MSRLPTAAAWLFGLCCLQAGCEERRTPPPEPQAQTERNAPLVATAPPRARVEQPPPKAQRPLPVSSDSQQLRTAPVEVQQEYLVELLVEQEGLGEPARVRLQSVLERSDWLSFGNPKASRPAMTKQECRERRAAVDTLRGDPACGSPNMVSLPLAKATDAPEVCVDQFEFPNVACEYPVVWVRASEAAELCAVMGKRLCDAHEWEGACAGSARTPDDEYLWAQLPKGTSKETRRQRRLTMEHLHNSQREIRWAYGAHKNHDRCGTKARKDPRCTTVDWGICGTNDFPAGAFPECVSPVGVYDLHGNVAEHMSLPIYPEELGGKGWTEMKGSWFIFSREEAHPDDCRWRARNWHTTRVEDPNSHRNYHLGFRCCRDL